MTTHSYDDIAAGTSMYHVVAPVTNEFAIGYRIGRVT